MIYSKPTVESVLKYSESYGILLNYTLGRPYEDTSNSFYESDVLDHRDDRPRVENRGDYRLVSAGIDWG